MVQLDNYYHHTNKYWSQWMARDKSDQRVSKQDPLLNECPNNGISNESIAYEA